MFLTVVRAKDSDEGVDMAPVAAFYSGDGEDCVADHPWEHWAMQVLEYLRTDDEQSTFALFFTNDAASVLGHWQGSMDELLAQSKEIETGLLATTETAQ